MDEAANSPEPPGAVDAPKAEAIPSPPNLGAILSIPVTVQVVLGSTSMPVAALMSSPAARSFRLTSASAIRLTSSSTAP